MLFTINLTSTTMMKRYISVLFASLLTINMFGTDPSVTLTTYYANIDGQSNTSDALRIALCTIISNGYTSTSYSNLKNDMYAASSNPTDFNNGSSKTLEDIYSSKAYTVSEDGSSATSCGTGWNKEHTIPQSWFNEATPMKSDAHHVFPTDIKMNSVRSNYPYGENNASLSCSSYGYGHLGTSTFSGYTGTVFDPGAGGENGSYKGDLARSYFYMVTRYRTTNFTNGTGNVCFTYTNNVADLTTYMKNLMLKWHREDPVSEKERIRNNAIYAHQHNRNPFIDYPELVEYIWGNKVGQTVALSSLTSGYVDGGNAPTTYNVTLNRNGSISVLSGLSDTYTLPTASTEADACDGWAFAGWSTSSSVNTTTAPSFTTSVSSATTLYAVYSHTESSSAPIRRVPATVGTTMWAETWTGATTATSGSDNATPSANYGKGTTVYNSGTITYTQSANTVYVRNENTGGGTAPELLLSSGKTWTISNIPTGEATELTLTYKSNNTKSSVTCSTTGASITGSSKSYTITTGGASTITLVFGCSGNTRIDDVSLTVKTAGSGGSSGGSTTTYMTTPTCGDTHTITLSGNGSTNGGEFSASNESAYAGATISLFATPEEGYQFGSWTVTKAGGGMLNVTNNQFTMPDADVTITASFTALPTYNIKFYNNGTQIGSTQSVYKGGKPNVPSNPESCEGYTFVGWWTSALAADNTVSKSWIEDFTVTQAQDYYAVFSHTVAGEGGGTTTKSMTSFSAISGNVDNDTNISYEAAKGTAGTAPAVNGSQIRIYQNGGTLTITANNSKKLTSVTIGSAMATTVTYSVDGGTASSNQSISADGTLTVGDLNATSILFTCKGTTSSSRLYLNSLSVTYSSGGSSSTTYYTSTTNCTTACTTLATPTATATPGNGQITLTWADVANADHYTVTISSKGTGYTTECGSAAIIGTISHSGTTNTCVITGLTNGLAYTTSVVANATSSTCDSEADSDTATPQECTQWDDPTLSWNKYSLNTSTAKTASVTISGTTHGTLSFESSNTDVLTVDGSTGEVTAQGAGEATVTAHWTANGGYCEKTMTSSTFEVAGPLTISFDANADGVTGSMTDQTVTYKVSTAIKDNAFRREGYTFIGWATSADGEKVYNDKQSVAFTNSQTLYAKWQLNSRNVMFTPSPSGATVTVNGKSTSPQAVNYGETVTVHIAPANHYTITTVSIKGATSGNDIAQTGSGETRTFTMPDENVTVSVTMTPESTYTATFYNSGVAYGVAQTGYADDDINAPATNPVSCDADEFTFVGWVAAEQTSETTTKPEVLTFPQTMPVGNVNYYALYRRVEGSGGGEATVTFKSKTGSDDGTDRTEDSAIKENLVESYTGISSFSASRAYLGLSGVKLGASGGSGYITLNLSSPITTNTITVHAAKYGTDTGNLQVEVNGSTSFGDEQSPADGTLTFTNASDVEISDLTISTTSKRAYVASISLGGGGTSYYTTSPVCTPCEHKVTLTKGAETNGTFTLSKANGEYDNCKSNFTVTVSNISPAEGYRFKNVTATGGTNVAVSGPDGSGNYAVNYAKGNSVTSTVTAHFEQIPSHTVTWSANGNTSNQVSYKEGATINFPATATGCDGMVFMGWSSTTIYPATDTEPSYVTSATMGTSDITYYAVFAIETTTSSGETSSVVDQLTRATTGVTNGSTTYSSWSGKTSNSNAVYAGQSAGGNDAIQLRSNNNNSGIVTTASGGKATKVTVVWQSNTDAERVLNVYGKNSAYTAATDLYSTSTQGTLIGTIDKSSSTELTISDDYEYIGMRSASGAMYLTSVSITWSTGSGSSSTTTISGYTTSCITPENVTVSFNANGGEGTMADQVIDYNTATALNTNAFTRTGYKFTGWNTAADGSGTAYADKTEVTLTRDITLYAQWKAIYTIRFIDNDAVISTQIVDAGESAVKPTNPTPCSNDYTFVGWWTAEIDPATTTVQTWITDFTAITANADQDYYAVYSYSETSTSAPRRAKMDGATYDKVTATSGITDGQYLIVYEDGGLAFDGSLATLDAVGNTISVTISENSIAVTNATEASEFTIGATNGTILSASGKYIGQGSDANGLATSTEALRNTLSIDGSGNFVVLSSGGAYLRYNSANNQTRFRYYKSATYSSQQTIQLYKKTTSGGSTTTTTYYTTAPDCEAPIVTSAKMLVAEFGGARVALAHDNTNTVAALPLMYFGGNYFIPNIDKNGNTASAPEKATLTWQVAERTDGYYIKSDDNKFLAQTEGEFALDKEKFLWPKSGTLRLAYDAATEAFVVAAGEQGELPGITPVDVPSTISTTELKSQRDLTIGKFGTICLPHAVALPFTWGVKVYSVDGVKMSNDVLSGIYLVEETEMLVAGKPYLIEAVATQMNMWYATGAPTADKVVEAVGLVGNLDASPIMYAPMGEYIYILLDNQLRRVGEGAKAKIGQYKAYFDLEDVGAPDALPQAHAYKVMYVEDSEQVATDVSETPATINWDEPVYNILGMRVDRNATGVLIQGGTKFIIRVP